ncbi:MAG: stage III sporulation protein AA [Bacillus sp. (in: Bacteria)]|jgi:stage III sporulation protein AA|nr:stage III sporulation protein AA [Bacillus sp. (in: firmicutes)]
MESVFSMLPKKVAEVVRRLPPTIVEEMEEIRLRTFRPVEVCTRGNPYFLPYTFTEEDAEHLINRLSNHSFYTLEEELKRGYITIEGGHRVGLAGKVVLEQGMVKGLRQLSSFNIRIARQKIGVGEPLIPFLFDGTWRHTMIIGSPQTGKTTLLRDLARIISSGYEPFGIPAMKVGIVDERSEIAGCLRGIPQLDFGYRVDVLDGCPKAEGMMMMIRSMSPDVLIVDEIGREEDGKAIMEAMNAGITLLTTTHGKNLEDIQKRPILQQILKEQRFQRFIELNRQKGPGSVAHIRGENGEYLDRKVSVT